MSWFSKSFGAIAGALGSIGSSIIGSNSAKSVSQQNYEASREAMQNKHQWEVEDLKRAGLNPILSATGSTGTTSGTGVSYSPENPFSSFLQNESVKAETKLKQAQIDNIKQQMAHNALFFLEDLKQRKFGTALALKQLEYYPKLQDAILADYGSQTSARDAAAARDKATQPIYEFGGKVLTNTAKALYGDGYNSDGSHKSAKDYSRDWNGVDYDFYGD